MLYNDKDCCVFDLRKYRAAAWYLKCVKTPKANKTCNAYASTQYAITNGLKMYIQLDVVVR